MKTILAMIYLGIGVYLGIAGWIGSKVQQNTSVTKSSSDGKESRHYEYDGIDFKDEDSLRSFIKQRSSSQLFPWLFDVPQSLMPLLAAASFGLVGGAGQLFKKTAIDRAAMTLSAAAAGPVFGAIVGSMLYFLALILPAVFTTGQNPVRTETLVGLSLLGGIFSGTAYDWIEAQVVTKLFKK